MNIFKEYVKGDIKKNKKNYFSTLTTIFLAVLILSTFIFGIFSYFKSYLDMPNTNYGNSHLKIESSISNKDANNLISNRYIEKIGLYNQKELSEKFGSKEKVNLIEMDNNALSTISSLLKEGTLPKENEIMISNEMSKEINKTSGDTLKINNKSYNISGIYYSETYDYQNYYDIYLNVKQEILLKNRENLSSYVWFENIYRTYSLSEKIIGNMETENILYTTNDFYLNRAFVYNPEFNSLDNYSKQLLVVVLFTILLVLFYIIIKNLFLVQESKSITEYSKLKSIGATNKDINKIIKLKTLYISQLPIILGILISLILVKILYFILAYIENNIFKIDDIFSIYKYLELKFDIKVVLFIYILSLTIIYFGIKKPIKKFKKLTILDGIKGNINLKQYKKYDLNYTGHIEKDLSLQIYKNSKYNFRFAGIILKIGFLIMMILMSVITIYSLDKKFNKVSKYETYNIQAEYTTIYSLKEEFLNEIKSLNIQDLVNFRKEIISLDLDQNMLSEEYKNSNNLNNLEKHIGTLDEIKIQIFGIEDKKFDELAKEKGINTNNYTKNSAILLNTIGDNLDLPKSRIKDVKFIKDDIKELHLAEDRYLIDIIGTRGYEFSLNIENKIGTPFFDYPIIKDGLNVYMPKSQYINLFNNFEKIGDLDQYEYLSLKTDNVEETQEKIQKISSEHFKTNDYYLESILDEELLTQRRNLIGSILAVFLSVFFMVVAFANCYFTFYNLFSKRKDELFLYKSIGMDKILLKKILQRERKKIIQSFLISTPFIIIITVFVISKIIKLFSFIEIILNLNILFIIVIVLYVLIIYLAVSKMYNKYIKELI